MGEEVDAHGVLDQSGATAERSPVADAAGDTVTDGDLPAARRSQPVDRLAGCTAGDDGMHGDGFAGVAHARRDVALSHPRSHAANHAEDRLADAQGSPGERGDLVRTVACA